MRSYFDIDQLLADRLLETWRWLVPQKVTLRAVDAFGDLFLEDRGGTVHKLDVQAGRLSIVSANCSEFELLIQRAETRREWFYEEVAQALAKSGLVPGPGQCLAYKIPVALKEGSGKANSVYIADIYEYVGYLGDFHRQILDVPDGGKVRLNVGPEPQEG